MADEEYHHVSRNHPPSALSRRLRSSMTRNKGQTNLDGFSTTSALPSIEEPMRSESYWSENHPPSRERKISSLPELSRSSFLINGGQQTPDGEESRSQSRILYSRNSQQQCNLPTLTSSLPHLPVRSESSFSTHSSINSPMPPISHLSIRTRSMESSPTKKFTDSETLPIITDIKTNPTPTSTETLKWHLRLKNGLVISDKVDGQIPDRVLKNLKKNYGHIDSFEVIVVKREGKFTTLTRPPTNQRKTPSLNMECEHQALRQI